MESFIAAVNPIFLSERIFKEGISICFLILRTYEGHSKSFAHCACAASCEANLNKESNILISMLSSLIYRGVSVLIGLSWILAQLLRKRNVVRYTVLWSTLSVLKTFAQTVMNFGQILFHTCKVSVWIYERWLSPHNWQNSQNVCIVLLTAHGQCVKLMEWPSYQLRDICYYRDTGFPMSRNYQDLSKLKVSPPDDSKSIAGILNYSYNSATFGNAATVSRIPVLNIKKKYLFLSRIA